MTWNIDDAPLPSRGFVRIEHYSVEVARIYKTGRAKYYGLGMLPKDTQDNAHLIVAAPDLLVAGKKALEWIHAQITTANDITDYDRQVYGELAAAIDKAVGAE